MQIHVQVDYQEAVRRGFAVDAESIVIDVSSEDLAGLSGENRELLAQEIATYRDAVGVNAWHFGLARNCPVPEPTLAGCIEAIASYREDDAAIGEWIEAHGSDRLKRRWRHRQEWDRLYWTELIERDYPGWTDNFDEVENRDLDQALELLESVQERWPAARVTGYDRSTGRKDDYTVSLDLDDNYLLYRWPDNK